MTVRVMVRRLAVVVALGGVSIWLIVLLGGRDGAVHGGSEGGSATELLGDSEGSTRHVTGTLSAQSSAADGRARVRVAEGVANAADSRPQRAAVQSPAAAPPGANEPFRSYAAPRLVGVPLPDEIVHRGGRNVDPTRQAIDDCTYVPISEAALKQLSSAVDYVALVDVDYRYDQKQAILGVNGEAETEEFTPLALRATQELVNRMGAAPDQMYLAGTCEKDGLCLAHGCETYVSSGRSLVFADRYCGPTARSRRVLIVNAVFPVEKNEIYSFDGSAQPLDRLLASALPDSRSRFEAKECPADPDSR